MTYEYKGNFYLIEDKVLMKHPATEEWIEAVTYKSVDGDRIYAREAKDFYDKFKRIDNG